MGLAQRDDETNAEYLKRVKNTSKIWKRKIMHSMI